MFLPLPNVSLQPRGNVVELDDWHPGVVQLEQAIKVKLHPPQSRVDGPGEGGGSNGVTV